MKRTALIPLLAGLALLCSFNAYAQPIASFTYTYGNGGCTPDLTTFTNTSLAADTFIWDFGDFSPPDSSTNPTHNYGFSGVFVVTLIAYDTLTGDSDITTDILTITMTPFPGWAFFFFNPPNPVCLGNTVDFNNFMFPAPTLSIWDFGDGDSSSVLQPEHLYADTGDYPVVFIAGNVCGTDTTRDTVRVDTNAPPPSPGMFFFPDPVCPGTPVDFNQFTFPDPISSIWDFGDGDSSLLYEPSHIYTTAGWKYLSLTVDNGCNDTTIFDSIYVDTTIIPSVFISGFPTNICPGDSVNFSSGGGNLVGFVWAFGDSTFSLQPDPAHVYTDTGVFEVVFTGTNTCGNSSNDTLYITVDSNATPFASWSRNPFNACPGTPVNFTNFSNNFTSSFWDFDDASTSTLENPTHVFADTGTYNVMLVVYNSCGGTDTQITAVTITNNATIFANFCWNFG
ncbi:MAG: PKD domain-containing protein, partial [Flavobacteriales bacterium]|nr:PKD domain-containing protein [Flavobacteriales bacterium]